jgi:hypothetical protein
VGDAEFIAAPGELAKGFQIVCFQGEGIKAGKVGPAGAVLAVAQGDPVRAGLVDQDDPAQFALLHELAHEFKVQQPAVPADAAPQIRHRWDFAWPEPRVRCRYPVLRTVGPVERLALLAGTADWRLWHEPPSSRVLAFTGCGGRVRPR